MDDCELCVADCWSLPKLILYCLWRIRLQYANIAGASLFLDCRSLSDLPKLVVVVWLQNSLVLIGKGEGLHKFMDNAISYG